MSATTAETEIKAEVKLRYCKKCDFACETQGQLFKTLQRRTFKGR